MNLLPLVLSSKRESWRMDDDDSRHADAEFATVRRKVRERDNHTCRFCGFRHLKADFYMQVHHKDDDHHNNSMENLVTACMHCHAVQHIGLWGASGEAVLVHLPEWPQFYLNHMCRLVLVARRFHAKVEGDIKSSRGVRPGGEAQPMAAARLKSAHTMMESMDALFERVKARTAQAEEYLGTSNPADLGTALLHAPEEVYLRRHEPLAPLRLLLLGHHHPGGRQESPRDVMEDIVDNWLGASGPFKGLEPSGWSKLIQTGSK